MHGDDVGVIEGGNHLRFTLETGETIPIGGEVLGQHLDRDVAIKRGVARPVHLSHTARPERSEDLVMSECLADQQFLEESGGSWPQEPSVTRRMRSTGRLARPPSLV